MTPIRERFQHKSSDLQVSIPIDMEDKAFTQHDGFITCRHVISVSVANGSHSVGLKVLICKLYISLLGDTEVLLRLSLLYDHSEESNKIKNVLFFI